MTTTQLVKKLKDHDQDHEFYPTTDKIINIIKGNLPDNAGSVLDIGAGDGRVLTALATGKKYAIEKSQILVKSMPPDIFVVGCDFYENTLIDKKVDVIFCNPPYTEFLTWTTKIIEEANCNMVFLVLPERWKDNQEIKLALNTKEAKAEIIGKADFLQADRQARAKVDVIKITPKGGISWNRTNAFSVDPFKIWVKNNFNFRKPETKEEKEEKKAQEARQKNELINAQGYIPALVSLYDNELAKLQSNFQSIADLDHEIFKELKINFNSITEFLKQRIEGAKTRYWSELFERFSPLTERLTKKSRESMLNTLKDNVNVDFNEQNAYAVTIWAIKNASNYFDAQLVQVFESLITSSNIKAYKSNKKTWSDDNWRFNKEVREGKLTHYALDYRIILQHFRSFSDNYDRWDYPNGLHSSCHDIFNDIIAIANNLDFVCTENSLNKKWEPGKAQDFKCNDGTTLMNVRAYKNGNLHIKFNQKFLRKLNIEFGRLKGWLRNHKEAAKELGIPEKTAKEYFNTNLSLDYDTGMKAIGM